jgi:O-succinylbenzoic acid--CoA ligase
MRMTHWLDKRAALTPDRIALIGGDGESVTFRALREKARAAARRLVRLGLEQSGMAAVLCRNGLHVPPLLHAVHYAGAIYLPLNIRLTPAEIVGQLADAGCRLLVFDEACRDLAEAVKRLLPDAGLVSAERLLAGDPGEAAGEEPDGGGDGGLQGEIDFAAVSTVMYTSGTTGRPKGVMHTFGNHWASAIGSALNLGLSERDRWLVALPLFHVGGLSALMKNVIYGMPVVIHDKFDPERAHRAILDQGVTIVSVVAQMLGRMLELPGGGRYPDAFRCMLLGGGPAPLPLLEACRDRGVPVFQTYGLTETASQIATLAPEHALAKLGSAGKPLFQSELKIVVDGREASPGETGEIAVRGPNVTPGYWNNPEATAGAIRDGWLYTGDIGYVDDEGFLFVLDRRSDLIISGGENVYPAEIEAVLAGHPDIAEAGVAGVPDRRWGKVPVAFVRPKPGARLAEEDVRRYCAERLARYKQPARVLFVDELPRNAAGKLVRKDLLRLLETGPAGESVR